MRGSKWGKVQTNALETLYRAGWGWGGISAHVSAIGPSRSPDACQSRAKSIGLKREAIGHPAEKISYDDDLIDMMQLDYSTWRMARELEAQYRRSFSQRWAYGRISKLPGFSRWRGRADARRARGVSVARRKAA